MPSKNFFWAKTSVALFLSFENCRKHCAIKAHVIDVKIAGVSNYKKFKSGTHMITRPLRDK